MNRTVPLLLLAGLLLLPEWLPAADIRPARRTVPEQFVNPPGKRFSLFSGDPERIQRANEINLKDFSVEIKLNPADISLSSLTTALEVGLVIRNNGRRSYTLSFPDAQRYDLAIYQGEELAYLWSEDKIFVQQTGSSFINSEERLTYTEALSPELLRQHLRPGTYTLKMILSNYPELSASTTITVQP